MNMINKYMLTYKKQDNLISHVIELWNKPENKFKNGKRTHHAMINNDVLKYG